MLITAKDAGASSRRREGAAYGPVLTEITAGGLAFCEQIAMWRVPRLGLGDPGSGRTMSGQEPSTTPKAHKLTRPMYFVAGLVLVGVGVVGYILPVMPGTIFLILAAACFARSSRRLEAWLVNHPKLGPSVNAWRKNGAIPRKIKFIAIGSMVISFAILVVAHVSPEWIALAGVAMLASALFVATRPEGPKAAG